MDNEILAITLTFLVHVVAIGALIWHLVGGEEGERPDWRGWFRAEDDEPLGPEPAGPRPRGGGVPLPDAEPASVRLREPARLADAVPKPARRPAHVPAPQPAREPERAGR